MASTCSELMTQANITKQLKYRKYHFLLLPKLDFQTSSLPTSCAVIAVL